jgi:hypothetical protein
MTKHPQIEVPNLHVCKLMQSLRSREVVKEKFNWSVDGRRSAGIWLAAAAGPARHLPPSRARYHHRVRAVSVAPIGTALPSPHRSLPSVGTSPSCPRSFSRRPSHELLHRVSSLLASRLDSVHNQRAGTDSLVRLYVAGVCSLGNTCTTR